MATPSLPALSAYRQILRATRVAFQSLFPPVLRLHCDASLHEIQGTNG